MRSTSRDARRPAEIEVPATAASSWREPLAWHVTMRPCNDGWVARRPAELRRAARIIHAACAEDRLFAFRVADTHVHVLLTGTRVEAGRAAQTIASALRQALHTARFEPARFRPITTQRHLHNALAYVLRQEERHGTDLDPAHDGSIVPDLLGMRLLDGGDAVLRRVRMHLPRLASADVRAWVDFEALERVDPDPAHLADAAAAALGLASVRSNDPLACLARRAATQALPLTSKNVAELIGVDCSSVRRLRRQPVPGALVRAVDLQLRLRTAIAGRVHGW